jgi:peptidoglycan/xylan/chitin deacetylase (PgdA/CDA1 family)
MSETLVLCYHAVSPSWPAPLSVTPASLESQLELLARRGYHGTTFSEAVKGTASGRAVVVTFDDAFRSVLTLAEPTLTRLGLVGTVFVPTDFPGAGRPLVWPGVDHWVGGSFEHELAPLSWEEVESLVERGWEIGSHTCSHPHLTALPDDALDEELERSRRECEQRLGRPCTSLAYPYGDYDERVIAAAGRAGYQCAGTLPGRLHPSRPLAWPRIGIYHADGDRRFRLKISPQIRELRASRAWMRLDAVRTRISR